MVASLSKLTPAIAHAIAMSRSTTSGEGKWWPQIGHSRLAELPHSLHTAEQLESIARDTSLRAWRALTCPLLREAQTV
jgi:hypothetical protein